MNKVKKTLATIALLGTMALPTFGQKTDLVKYMNTSENSELISEVNNYISPEFAKNYSKFSDNGINEILRVKSIISASSGNEGYISEAIVRVNSFNDARNIAKENNIPLFYDPINKVIISEDSSSDLTDEQKIMEYNADYQRLKDKNLRVIDKNGNLMSKDDVDLMYRQATRTRSGYIIGAPSMDDKL